MPAPGFASFLLHSGSHAPSTAHGIGDYQPLRHCRPEGWGIVFEGLLDWVNHLEAGADSEEQSNDDVLQFLGEILENKGQGARFVKSVIRANIFKRFQKNTHPPPVVNAVCATFAALLKHTGLSKEALVRSKSRKRFNKRSPIVLLWGKAYDVVEVRDPNVNVSKTQISHDELLLPDHVAHV
uniref:Uncharacterized protein n=1 Tax=Lotharella globosa TaxID=91324 RepID=A0A7S3YF01_9EUKA